MLALTFLKLSRSESSRVAGAAVEAGQGRPLGVKPLQGGEASTAPGAGLRCLLGAPDTQLPEHLGLRSPGLLPTQQAGLTGLPGRSRQRGKRTGDILLCRVSKCSEMMGM